MTKTPPVVYNDMPQGRSLPVFQLRLRRRQDPLTAAMAAAGVLGIVVVGIARASVQLFVFLSTLIPLLFSAGIVFSLAKWGYSEHHSLVGAIGGAFIGLLAAGALYIFVRIAVPIALLAGVIGIAVHLTS
jgi:hypothetical protein